MNARSIPRTGLIRATGNDLASQNDEPERTFAESVDSALHADKLADGYEQRRVRGAIELDQRQADINDRIGGSMWVGWL